MLLPLNMADLSGLDRDLIPAQKMSQKNILKERAAAICQKSVSGLTLLRWVYKILLVGQRYKGLAKDIKGYHLKRDIRAGYPTAWQMAGSGSRAVLLLHCSLAQSSAWRGLLSEMAQSEHQFTMFDLPGHGDSLKWDFRGAFHDVSTAVAASFLDQKMDLIGHSFGASVALRLAVEHPDLVRSLTLIEPVIFSLGFAYEPASKKAFLQDHSEFDRAIARDEFVSAARAFHQIWGSGQSWDRLPDKVQRGMVDKIHLIPAAASHVVEDAYGFCTAGLLEKIEAPVLLLQGSASSAPMPAVISSLQSRLPYCLVKTLEGAGHMAPITHAKATAAHIQSFLKNHPV